MTSALRARTRRGGIATILSGSVIGQGVVLAASPLVTRLYGPTDFGTLASVTAIAAVIGSIAAAGLDRALVVARGAVAADTVRMLAWAALAVTIVVTAGLSLAMREVLTDVFSAHVASLWWVIPTSVLAIGVQRITAARLARDRDHAAVGLRNAVQGMVQLVITIVFAPIGAVGLVVAPALSRLAAFTGTAWSHRKRVGRARSLSWRRLAAHPRLVRAVLMRYRAFLLLTPVSSLLNVAGQQAPLLVIASTQGVVFAGLLGLTTRVLATPVGMIADATSQWFVGGLSEAVRTGAGGTARMVLTASARLFVIALPLAGAVMVFGPTVFATVFGEAWRSAGQIVVVLAPLFAVQVAVSPVSQALVVLERQRTQLLWDAGRAVAVVGSVLVTGLVGGSSTTVVLAMVVAASSAYFILLLLVLNATRHHDRQSRIKNVKLQVPPRKAQP